MHSVTNAFYKLPNMNALRQDRTEKVLWYSQSCNYFTVKSDFFSPPPLKWQHKDKECNHLLNKDDI